MDVRAASGIPAVVLLAALAGCVDQEPAQDVPDLHSTVEAAMTSVSWPKSLEGGGCVSSRMHIEGRHAPPPPPPEGWQVARTVPTYMIKNLECWGVEFNGASWENIQMTIFAHSYYSREGPCSSDQNRAWFVQKAWTSNESFANVLEDAFGLPFGIASYDASVQISPPLSERTLDLQGPLNGDSVTFRWPGDQWVKSDERMTFILDTERGFFSWNRTGRHEVPQFAIVSAYGYVGEWNHIYPAGMPVAGQGWVTQNGRIAHEFHRYEDSLCQPDALGG